MPDDVPGKQRVVIHPKLGAETPAHQRPQVPPPITTSPFAAPPSDRHTLASPDQVMRRSTPSTDAQKGGKQLRLPKTRNPRSASPRKPSLAPSLFPHSPSQDAGCTRKPTPGMGHVLPAYSSRPATPPGMPTPTPSEEAAERRIHPHQRPSDEQVPRKERNGNPSTPADLTWIIQSAPVSPCPCATGAEESDPAIPPPPKTEPLRIHHPSQRIMGRNRRCPRPTLLRGTPLSRLLTLY